MDGSSRPASGTTRGIEKPIYPQDSVSKPNGMPDKPDGSEPIYGNIGMSTSPSRDENVSVALEKVAKQNLNKTYDGLTPGNGRTSESEAYATLGEEEIYYQL